MNDLPRKVRISHGAYYYDEGRDDSGKRRWVWLCRVTDGEHALYTALARHTRPGGHTVGQLMDEYIGVGMGELAEVTRKDYLGYIRRTLRPVFGEMHPEDLQPIHVAQFLEQRKQQGAPAVANKEMACLSSIYNWAMRAGKVSGNPCRVRRNKVRPRDRYVRNDEFLAAFEASSEPLQDFMAVLYLTGLRTKEVRTLTRANIVPDGLRIEESKTGKVRLIEWSESLRFFILRAASRTPHSDYLLTNSRGERWEVWALQSALRRLREQVGGERWTWHDIRAKAESDSKEGLGLLPLYRRARRTKPVW